MVSDKEELVETLKAFRLTYLEAKTYVALVELGESTVETIARHTKTARQNLYIPLSKLEKISLVEKMLDTPPKYKALDTREATSILIENRNRENQDVQEKLQQLITSFKTQQETGEQKPKICTKMISGIKMLNVEVKRMDEHIEISFDGTATAEQFRQGMCQGGQSFRAAVKRGVQYRHIISKAVNRKMVLGDEDLRNNPFWKVRYIAEELPMTLAIVDKKQVCISRKTHNFPKDCVNYLSNEECFIVLAQNYFEMLWNSAQDWNS